MFFSSPESFERRIERLRAQRTVLASDITVAADATLDAVNALIANTLPCVTFRVSYGGAYEKRP